MPAGFLGTRANLLLDLILLVTLATPLVMLASFRLVRARKWQQHRRVQVGWLVLCFTAVFTFEGVLRLQGGSGSFVSASPYAGPALRTLLNGHIAGAILTYTAWLVLAVMSHRRAEQVLPGTFSRRHKKVGWLVFGGAIYTAVTALGMYVFTFAL
ncbi:MAG: DUF420 domain-containing protein [Myxococcota bacterium]